MTMPYGGMVSMSSLSNMSSVNDLLPCAMLLLQLSVL